MCGSAREFVRAPLGDDGLRRAWFLPFGSYEDGSFDLYAPMGSDPSDEHSSTFYSNGVGQLTHYHSTPGFASLVTKCFSSIRGFSRSRFEATDDTFRASVTDRRMNRRIEVAASRGIATFRIASAEWTGDIEDALERDSTSDCE